MPLWPFIALLFAGIAYSFYVDRQCARALAAMRSQFQTRPVLNRETWFNQHFAACGIPAPRVIELLQPIAEAMQCDVTQLLPTDSFETTLRWRQPASFLGLAEDSPWDDWFEDRLAQACGSEATLTALIDQLGATPSLAQLVTGKP